MNVAFDPWIPVVTTTGEPELISLCAALTEGEKFSDLAVRPHERVSLMRLFLCVAHAALDGPKDYDEWLEVPKKLPESVQKYLGKWKDSFELFHDKKPWLQVAQLEIVPSGTVTQTLVEDVELNWDDVSKKLIDNSLAKKKNKKEVTLIANLEQDKNKISEIFGNDFLKIFSILEKALIEEDEGPDNDKGWSTLNKLCFTRASGNNTTLFDHESMGKNLVENRTEEIVLNLLTYQNFFVAGGKAASRMWDQKELKNPPNPKGGPCAGKSILYTFLRGSHVRESIILNLSTFEDLRLVYQDAENWLGKPIWEKPIKAPNDQDSIENATKTHIGRLVPQTRMLRINEDKKRVLLGPGFLYPKYQDEKNIFYPDIFATMVIDRNGNRQLLSARPSISVWRELHSLSICRKNFADSSRGALCLLNLPDSSSCDITVNSMLTDPQKAADIVNLLESVFHIPAKLRTSEGNIAYEKEVEQSGLLAQRLGWAVENYRLEVDGGWKGRLKAAGPKKGELKGKLFSMAFTHYWTAVEKKLPLLMNHIESIGTGNATPTLEAWRKMIFYSAREAYQVACGQETPRQKRAYALGYQKLIGQNDVQKENMKEELFDE